MLELAHRAGRPELESLALTQLASVAGVQGEAAAVARAAGARRGARRVERQPRGDGVRARRAWTPVRRGGVRRGGEVPAPGAGDASRDGRRGPLRLDAVQSRCGLRAARRHRPRGEDLPGRGSAAAGRRTSRGTSSRRSAGWRRCSSSRARSSEADRLVAEAQRRVGRGDVWTRASILHARRARPGGAGPDGRGGGRDLGALEIIEPTMYAILAQEIRQSLESLRAGTAATAVVS